jgi:hypothetical protein
LEIRNSNLLPKQMQMDVTTTESACRIPPRGSSAGTRRAERPRIEQVEAALADAPHRRIRQRPYHEKFVSKASGKAERSAERIGEEFPLKWKDAATFGAAQEYFRNGGHLEQCRIEALRFRVMVAAGSALALIAILLAFSA